MEKLYPLTDLDGYRRRERAFLRRVSGPSDELKAEYAETARVIEQARQLIRDRMKAQRAAERRLHRECEAECKRLGVTKKSRDDRGGYAPGNPPLLADSHYAWVRMEYDKRANRAAANRAVDALARDACELAHPSPSVAERRKTRERWERDEAEERARLEPVVTGPSEQVRQEYAKTLRAIAEAENLIRTRIPDQVVAFHQMMNEYDADPDASGWGEGLRIYLERSGSDGILHAKERFEDLFDVLEHDDIPSVLTEAATEKEELTSGGSSRASVWG